MPETIPTGWDELGWTDQPETGGGVRRRSSSARPADLETASDVRSITVGFVTVDRWAVVGDPEEERAQTRAILEAPSTDPEAVGEAKAGHPYMGHVRRVVDAVTTPDEKLVAALHDLLEDTPLTRADLLAAGCPPRIIVAVEALTGGPGEDYEALVHRAAEDPIARVVKAADVADNADEARLRLLEPEQAARLRSKYELARAILARHREPGPETLRNIEEAEFAEIGIPSGEADVSVTFWCEDCRHPAGTLAIVGSQVVVASFLGRMSCTVDEDLDAFRSLLENRDVDALYARDAETVLFWCPLCRCSYCDAHWDQETLLEDGFFDEVRGRCPRGHARKLWD